MAAAAATAAATLEVIPAAEDKIARIEGVVNVLDQRTVGAITARQCFPGIVSFSRVVLSVMRLSVAILFSITASVTVLMFVTSVGCL